MSLPAPNVSPHRSPSLTAQSAKNKILQPIVVGQRRSSETIASRSATNSFVSPPSMVFGSAEMPALDPNNPSNKITMPKAAPKGSYVRDPWWITGLSLQVVGACMDFTALGLAPASVVAPLGSLTLVTNVVLAPIMHHERPSNKTVLATLLIILGTICSVVFSPRTSAVQSTEAVFALFHGAAFWYYAIPTSALMILCLLTVKYLKHIKAQSAHSEATGMGEATGFGKRYTSLCYKVHRFCIATLSGTMGAQNIFFAKCVSTLLFLSAEGSGRMMFLWWQTYLVLGGMLCTIYFQLKWLNEGLMEFSALYIVPIFQSFWITVSVLGGLTVYQEFERMEPLDRMIFPLGVLVTIFGVAFLTSQQKPKQIRVNSGHKESMTETEAE